MSDPREPADNERPAGDPGRFALAVFAAAVVIAAVAFAIWYAAS